MFVGFPGGDARRFKELIKGVGFTAAGFQGATSQPHSDVVSAHVFNMDGSPPGSHRETRHDRGRFPCYCHWRTDCSMASE